MLANFLGLGRQPEQEPPMAATVEASIIHAKEREEREREDFKRRQREDLERRAEFGRALTDPSDEEPLPDDGVPVPRGGEEIEPIEPDTGPMQRGPK
jgi:hypothetical protein